MKTILVPTDFSDNAWNALQYAAELNKNIHAKIRIFHSYMIPVPITEVPVSYIPTDEEIRKDCEKSLHEIKRKISLRYPGMSFSTKLIYGEKASVAGDIVDEEKKSKCDLVIMGTKGASGLREVLIGSNTASLAGKSVCPVISVPERATMNGLHKIVFAANYGEDDFKNVFDVIDMARIFDAEVILLHIATGAVDKTFEFNELNAFKEQISTESQYPKISFKLLDDRDVFHGLNVYLDEVKADLISISMRNRTFAQKFFSHSLTKKMAYHSHIPVIVYHTSV